MFYPGPTRAAKAEQKYLVPEKKDKEPTKEGPLSLYSSSPHSPQFQQSAEATTLYSSPAGYINLLWYTETSSLSPQPT